MSSRREPPTRVLGWMLSIGVEVGALALRDRDESRALVTFDIHY